MTAHRGPATTCACCNRPGRHAARGLVDACYARHKAAGTLDRFCRQIQQADVTREEHEFLAGQGLDDAEIVTRLDITPGQLKYALKAKA